MKMKFRLTALVLLFALLLSPTGSVFAQGPGPGSGRVIFGSNITIESGETFDGDLVLFGGNVTVREGAELNGDLVVIGGNILTSGSLKGDVVVVGGQIKLEEAAVVSGDVVLIGGQMQRAEGAKIGGEVVNNAAPQIDIPNGKVPPVVPEVPSSPLIPDVPGVVNVNFNPLFEFGRVFAASLLMAVLGALAVLFFQERLDKVSRAVVVQPLVTTSVGLLTIVALLVVAVTIVLLPVALLSLIPLGFAWLFGVIAIGHEIGERFAKAMRQEWTPVITTGLGTFILMFVVGFIQALNDLSWVVGCFTWIVPAFVGLLAIGAVVVTRFGAQAVRSPAMSVYGSSAESSQAPPASEA